jgi:glutamine amidotransferase
MKIAVIDYGVGNLKSVAKAIQSFGVRTIITSNYKDLTRADKIVLPGVGAFGEAVDKLKKTGLFDAIKENISCGKPFLGICLGMHLLFARSQESPHKKGLSFFPGEVKLFKLPKPFKVPHMGWNRVEFSRPLNSSGRNIFKGIKDNSYFYFCHSFYAAPKDTGYIAGKTNYGIDFTSVIAYDNVFAIQFHPEKSQKLGIRFLKNFVEL